MGFDFLSVAALAVVIALFAGIFFLSRKINYTFVILGAMAAGAVAGYIFRGHTSWIAPIGNVYVSILMAIVAPLIIVAVLSSVTSLTSTKQLKGIGAKSVLWLMISNASAVVLTIGVGLVTGVGRNSYLMIEGVDASQYKNVTKSFADVFTGFFPQNVVGDISKNSIIPIILFTLLIAVSYVIVATRDREKVAPFKRLVDSTKEIVFTAVDFVLELTPYAVLALIATSVGNNTAGKEIAFSLLVLLLVSFVLFILHTFAVNAVFIKAFAKLPALKFFAKIAKPQIIAFSTQSSVGSLPSAIGTLREKIGVSEKIADFTAPLGTTIGMPGCAGIWPVLVAIYGIHGLGINYGFKDYLLLAIVGVFVSLGTAGVPGTATMTTASVLTALGLPLEIMVLVIPISAIADTGRTATNITAAIVSSAIVAREENALDDRVFNGEIEYKDSELLAKLNADRATASAAL